MKKTSTATPPPADTRAIVRAHVLAATDHVRGGDLIAAAEDLLFARLALEEARGGARLDDADPIVAAARLVGRSAGADQGTREKVGRMLLLAGAALETVDPTSPTPIAEQLGAATNPHAN